MFKSRRGFTLIELLVIAIIAILIGLLFPQCNGFVKLPIVRLARITSSKWVGLPQLRKCLREPSSGGRDGRPAGQTNIDCCNWDDSLRTTKELLYTTRYDRFLMAMAHTSVHRTR